MGINRLRDNKLQKNRNKFGWNGKKQLLHACNLELQTSHKKRLIAVL
jgi:hypothetical protein